MRARAYSRISFAPHIKWDEFVIVNREDIPGRNRGPLIGDDQPISRG